MRKICFIALLLCLSSSIVFAQEKVEEKIDIDFRNQKVSDIVLSVAKMCGKSVSLDDTVAGIASFHFEDKSFDVAIRRFCESNHIFIDVIDDIYYFTKVHIKQNGEGYYVDCENVPVESFLRELSRFTHTTIMCDSLPNVMVTVREENASVEDVLRLVMLRLGGYSLDMEGEGFFIGKNSSKGGSGRGEDFRIELKDSLYSLTLRKGSLTAVIDTLFKKAGMEYSLLLKNSIMLENLYYSGKDFDTLLRLILEQSACDYAVAGEIYYLFEVQKKDILKKLKETTSVRLVNINADAVMALFPSDLNAGAFVKADKSTNTLYVTGSTEETAPILSFIESVDIPAEDRYYQCFTLKNITVANAVPLIPKSMLYGDITVIPDSMSFVTLVTKEREQMLLEYLALIDKKKEAYPVRLRYIKSEELMKFLPPSVHKENLTVTDDSTLVFFTGPEDVYQTFMKELALMDKPKQQVCYQVLVIQRQRSHGLNSNSQITMSKLAGSENDKKGLDTMNWMATLGNLFSINFDIVSFLGIQFAALFNAELGEGRSHVLADTRLNGISGQTINFSNTSTFRYRDIVPDTNRGVYSSTTREISSGLVLSINGWVSGDDMITVDVNAQVSNQGTVNGSTSDTTNPPGTTEKKVSTNVRTESGTPIVISGLLQSDKEVTVKKVPLLGSIPLLGHLFRKEVESDSETEFAIYLVPFVEKPDNGKVNHDKRLRQYYEEYVTKEK